MVAIPLTSNCMVISWHTATGGTLFSTVTIAVQVLEFPFTSVTVKVTVLVPTSAQVNILGDATKVSIPQASVLPPSISAPVMVAIPLTSNCTVISWQIAVGATLSSTVTVAVHVLELPFTSVTVKVTVFGPTSAQVNELGLTESDAIPQASVEPPSTSAAVMDALPVASSCTVISWQIAVGATLSSTVTLAVQVAVFPPSSVTVSVTTLTPTSAQVNVFGLAAKVILQLSVEPPSISAPVILAWPLASNCTVISWHTATGGILSSTVTVAVQLALFPLTSVTVTVTVLVPISAQVKSVCDTVTLATPQLSLGFGGNTAGGVKDTKSLVADQLELFLPGTATPNIPSTFSTPCVWFPPSLGMVVVWISIILVPSYNWACIVTLLPLEKWSTLKYSTMSILLGAVPVVVYRITFSAGWPPFPGSISSQARAIKLFGPPVLGITWPEQHPSLCPGLNVINPLDEI